jgi:hypothetical protein
MPVTSKSAAANVCRVEGEVLQRHQKVNSCPWLGSQATAPVSHQKQPERTTTNAIESKRKLSKINEAD